MLKTVVIISVHAKSNNTYSSADFNGYKEFALMKEAEEFIKENGFIKNKTYIDSELDLNLIYLETYTFNRNRDKIEKLFTDGLSPDALVYCDKQEDIRNAQKKIDGFIYCKKYEEMTSEDYKGSLNKSLTQTTIDYISSGVVAGYLGHSARKHEHDKYIEEIIDKIIITVDCVEVDKLEIFSIWLTSSDARHWMDSVEELELDEFKVKLNDYIPELMSTGYIYSLKEHKGTYKSTMELNDIYAGRINVNTYFKR